MNQIVKLALLAACAGAGQAQTIGGITIGSAYPWAQFSVDGRLYTGKATFTWPQGTQHSVQFRNDLSPATAGCAGNLATALQFSNDQTTLLAFGGWSDNNGLLQATGAANLTITADPTLTSLTATVTVTYRVLLQMAPGATAAGSSTPCLAGGGAPGDAPQNAILPGTVYVGGTSYWGAAILYLAGATNLNAFPYPGFVFTGWNVNGNQVPAALTSINIQGPINLYPQFETAKRVQFVTNPMGLNVLVDYTSAPTPPYLNPPGTVATCPPPFTLPPLPPPGILPLCFGEFDFVPNSSHVIGAPTPQNDINGKVWAFDSWDRGSGQNTVYTADGNTATPDRITANFVPAAVLSFYSNPPGLSLLVDGRSNWQSTSFVWALGSTHTVSAPPAETDSSGRKYAFTGWSNNGPASQSVTVDQAAVANGFRMTASYSVLNRLTIQTSPPGLTLQVDGATCQSPCIVDKQSGSQTRVTAPSSVAAGTGSRMDFASWSDSGAADHVVTMSSDTQTVTANFQTMYQVAASTNPSNGATFQFSPTSPDMFFPAGTNLTVNAQTNPGYKFRRWGGDLSGTYPSGSVSVGQPCNIVALLDTVPYIPPAGIQNAAGVTPDQVVAPGSIIAVFGTNLTSNTIQGPTSPLSQTLGGVALTTGDRILPLLFVSPNQVNAQLPPDLPEGDYTLAVSATGQPDVDGVFTVRRNAPGLFTNGTADAGPLALAFHHDGSVITASSPAQQGETVTVYGTGFGPCQQALIAGFLLPAGAPNALLDALAIQLGTFAPSTVFAGAAPDLIGMEIARFQITPDLPSGMNLPLTVTVNGRQSNTVLLPLQ